MVAELKSVPYSSSYFRLRSAVPSCLKLKMCAPKINACEICSTLTSAPAGTPDSVRAASALRFWSMRRSISRWTSGFQIFQ